MHKRKFSNISSGVYIFNHPLYCPPGSSLSQSLPLFTQLAYIVIEMFLNYHYFYY